MQTPSTDAPAAEVTLGGRAYRIDRPTALKASRALAMLKELSRRAPELQGKLATFRRDYETANVLELDRVQAKLRFPPRPVTERTNGTEVVVLDEHGAPRMIPSPVDRLTEEDWTAAGGVYRIPASPSGAEVAAALLADVLETAEDVVYRFLALFTIPNDALKEARRAGRDDEVIRERADELLDDLYADDLLELAVHVSETVDHHFRRKADAMGPRMAGVARLFGLTWTPTATTPAEENAPTPSGSRPSSSTATPASTDGGPTPSSTPLSTSSSSSEASSSATPDSASSPSSNTATAAAA